MKVALLSDCFPPRLGGIEMQVRDLALRLSAAGHEVEVFTATPGPDGACGGAVEEHDGLRVHRFALPLPWGPLTTPVNPLATPELARRLRSGGFDVAHVHMGVVSPFAMDAARVALAAAVPTVITWHCLLERSVPLMRTLGYAARWARRGAVLTAVSTLAAQRVAGIAGGATVGVLPNGIDAAVWARPTGRPDRADDVLRVVSALRLAPRKRPLALLDVLAGAAALLPAGVRLEARLLGDGPLRGELTREIERRGMAGWVFLPGRVSREELREELWDADVALSTTRLEAFGIALLEARAAGVPVLARSGTGADDILTDGVDALLRGSDEELAAALADLAADPARLAALRAGARSAPPAQDWASVLDATLAAYAAAPVPR